MDYSGCGNTLNCNHPITEDDRRVPQYGSAEIGRLPLRQGSILARGQKRQVMAYPPVIWEIELSETLADVKIIAEGVGCRRSLPDQVSFPGFRWAEWNGKFRDDIRRFLR